MAKTRNRPLEFNITGEIKGVKKSDVKDGILETQENALIAKLRAHENAELVFRERVS